MGTHLFIEFDKIIHNFVINIYAFIIQRRTKHKTQLELFLEYNELLKKKEKKKKKKKKKTFSIDIFHTEYSNASYVSQLRNYDGRNSSHYVFYKR
jgi:hypothetical protein